MILQALQQLITDTGHTIVPEDDYTQETYQRLIWLPYDYPDTTTLLVLKPMKIIVIENATIHVHKSLDGDRTTIDLTHPNSLESLEKLLK